MADTVYIEKHGIKGHVEYEEESSDLGATWVRTGNIRVTEGEEDACDCSTLYTWNETSGYICISSNKYKKLSFQIKDDCGSWRDVSPQMIKYGDLIETNSKDCSQDNENISAEQEFRTVTSSPYCDGLNLVQDSWLEILVSEKDSRWVEIDGSRTVNIIQTNATECLPPIEPQYKTEYSEEYCEGMVKYKNAINSVSYDEGVTWEVVSTTKTTVSSFSPDCAVSSSWKDEGSEYCDGSNLVKTQRRWYKTSDGKEYKDTSDGGVKTVVVDTDSYECIDYGCPSNVTVEIISGWEAGGTYDGIQSDVCGFVTQSNRDSIGTYKIRIHFNENGTYRIMYDPDSLANIGAGDPPNNLYLSSLGTPLKTSNLSYALVQVKNSIRDGSMDYTGKSFVDVWFVKQSAEAELSTTTTGKVSIGIQKIN